MNESLKVLIIDDNKGITDMTAKLLKVSGHECLVANDGKNGLALIDQQKFDTIILDLAMPDFSGIDVIESLYKSGKIKDEKIIVLTASMIDDKTEKEILAKGVKAVLRKPIDSDILMNIIEN